jgi:hypothetical protein
MMSMNTTSPTITLRSAAADDAGWLERLAALDSSDLPDGPLVIAERDDQIIAAISATTMQAIADPFERTADALDLLRRHVASQVRASRQRRRLALVPRVA